MAHSRTAKKRIRQNATSRALNRWRLRDMREAVKDFNEQILHGSAEQAAESFKKVLKVIDRTAQKGVIHKNQAARRKSRMNARLKAKKAAPAAKA
jgi:small subunit ribosomal protein S20